MTDETQHYFIPGKLEAGKTFKPMLISPEIAELIKPDFSHEYASGWADATRSVLNLIEAGLPRDRLLQTIKDIHQEWMQRRDL